ncbi:Uncharacterised protein [Legionella pneumophila]|nr:Uncharacterised protein [Legionella pneumophila]
MSKVVIFNSSSLTFPKDTMSSMPSNKLNNCWLQSKIHSAYCTCTGSVTCSFISSAIPTTPLRGVLRSWLILAMNSVFTLFASSAASLALLSSNSIFFLSVISTDTPSIPIILPSRSRRGTLFDK